MLGLAEDDRASSRRWRRKRSQTRKSAPGCASRILRSATTSSRERRTRSRLEAGYAPRGDAARRLGRTTPEPKPEHLGKAPKKPGAAAEEARGEEEDRSAATTPRGRRRRRFEEARARSLPPSEDESEDDGVL